MENSSRDFLKGEGPVGSLANRKPAIRIIERQLTPTPHFDNATCNEKKLRQV